MAAGGFDSWRGGERMRPMPMPLFHVIQRAVNIGANVAIASGGCQENSARPVPYGCCDGATGVHFTGSK